MSTRLHYVTLQKMVPFVVISLRLIMVHIFNRLRKNLFNYTTCFDPNGSSSGVFSYTSFTVELQREIHTFLLTYIGHKLLRAFSVPWEPETSTVHGCTLIKRIFQPPFYRFPFITFISNTWAQVLPEFIVSLSNVFQKCDLSPYLLRIQMVQESNFVIHVLDSVYRCHHW
jgi:hypothetical protein